MTLNASTGESGKDQAQGKGIMNCYAPVVEGCVIVLFINLLSHTQS